MESDRTERDEGKDTESGMEKEGAQSNSDGYTGGLERGRRDREIEIEIDWTPGHADVKGNKVADKLAKQAAKETEEIPEIITVTTIMVDVRDLTKAF